MIPLLVHSADVGCCVVARCFVQLPLGFAAAAASASPGVVDRSE